MKLLLTSWWITNDFIKNAFLKLLWKHFEESNLVFIPTASTFESWDKFWLINDLITLNNLNFKSFKIVDIAIVWESVWKEAFENADVLYFEWWITYELMKYLNKTWITKIMPELLKNKVYVWVSAWSMVTSPDLWLKLSYSLYDEPIEENIQWLNLVDFYFLPHLNSDYFTKVRKENILETSKNLDKPIYVLDDNSAIFIENDKMEIIGWWEWFKI